MIYLYSVNTNRYEKTVSSHRLNDEINYQLIDDEYLSSRRALSNDDLWNRSDRYYKMKPHLLTSDVISVYCDANMTLIQTERLLELCDFLAHSCHSAIFFQHPDRTSVGQEVQTCLARGLDEPQKIKGQYFRYLQEGFPDSFGLTENNVIIRKNHDQKLMDMEDEWFSQYDSGAKRDQLTLLYACWKTSYFDYLLLPQKVKEEIFKWRYHGT